MGSDTTTMHRHHAHPRGWTAAALAAVAAAAAAAGLQLAALPGARAAIPIQGSTSTSPTPCPTLLPGSICLPGGTPPRPTPAPTRGATPTPAPTSAPPSGPAGTSSPGSPGSGQPAAAAAPGTTPGSPPAVPPASGGAAATQPASPATLAHAAVRFANAPFLGSLLEILAHPTSAQRPDLHHFRPPGGRGGEGGGGSAPGPVAAVSAVAAAAGAEGTRPLGIALLVGALAALAAGATVGRRRDAVAVRRRVAAAGARLCRGTPRLHLIRRRLPQWGLLVAAILGIAPVATGAALVGTAVQRGGAAPQSVGPPGRDVRTAASIRTEMAGDVPDATARGANAPATWTRLLTIERGLTAQQDELAAQEREIARVTALIGVDVTDEDRLPVPLGTYADLTARLASLVTAHQSTQAAYQRSLQAEYDLYRAAAQVVAVSGMKPFVAMGRAAPTPKILTGELAAIPRAAFDAMEKMDRHVVPHILRGAASSDLPPKESLQSLDIPTLILAWEGDPGHPLATAEELDRLLPQSELHIAREPSDVLRWPELVTDFSSP